MYCAEVTECTLGDFDLACKDWNCFRKGGTSNRRLCSLSCHLSAQVSAETPIKTEVLRTKVEITLVKVSNGVSTGVING